MMLSDKEVADLITTAVRQGALMETAQICDFLNKIANDFKAKGDDTARPADERKMFLASEITLRSIEERLLDRSIRLHPEKD